jgi:protein-tyrosine phosphatase
MHFTELFWIDGPWPGKLALAARPRGGDWLKDEMAGWRSAGVDTVLSLLTEPEEADLDLQGEAVQARSQGMEYLSFPIEDRQVPRSPSELAKTVEDVERDLSSGKNVVIHCRQGVGRSGLVGACVMIGKGLDAKTAIDRLSAGRGVPIPETAEQRHWIDYYAGSLAGTQ